MISGERAALTVTFAIFLDEIARRIEGELLVKRHVDLDREARS